MNEANSTWTSRWFDPLFRTEEMRRIFSDTGRLQGILDFEAALAKAQANADIIPEAAVKIIAANCYAGQFNLVALAEASAAAGNSAIPVIKELTRIVHAANPAAAQYVHFGATSQDAMDTGLVLQMRAGLELLESDARGLCSILAALANQHKETPMAGRTWLQHAAPTTFGLKAAGWLDAMTRQTQRMQALRREALVLQLGGAVGTRATLGNAAAGILAVGLGLGRPELPWHAQRDRLAEVSCVLGVVVGTLGKMARDISLLAQSEVAEVAEPSAPGRGGSSSMPQKRNPIGCAAVLATATRMPGLVSTMLAAMPQEHERGLGGWQAEWDTLPEIFLLTAGALAHMRQIIGGLHVDPKRMLANLELTNGLIYAESVSSALAKAIGQAAAHAIVERACGKASEQGIHLREVVAHDAEISAHLNATEVAGLFDPQRHVRAASALVDRTLAAWHRDVAGQPPFVEIEGARIHYDVRVCIGSAMTQVKQTGTDRIAAPSGPPTILFSNSLGTDLSLWNEQVKVFESQFRVLRYDARGHGGSSAPKGPYSIGMLGTDVLRLLDELQIDRVHFCGLSLGGMIGMWLAAHHPDRVHKLVLANTAPILGPPSNWDARIAAVEKGGMAAIVDAVVERWYTPAFRAKSPEQVEMTRRMILSTPPAGYIACCAAIRDMDQRAFLQLIKAPTLVIGGKDDPATPPAVCRALAETIPGARYVELAAAHLSNIEAADAFNDAVLAFLKE